MDKNNKTWGEKTPIIVVVGGQYGSESKGLIAAQLCIDREIKYAVRTGAINAGHTVYYKGKKYVNQQLPVGWIGEGVNLILGAGAYIHEETLKAEIKMIEEATGKTPTVFIDHNAGIHTDEHHKRENGMHERMGSTGEGCGEALKDKVSRDKEYRLFGETEHNKGHILIDTSGMLNNAYDAGEAILLEGTQGTLLDLHYGHYPYVTSRQTIASSWVTEAGLSPSLEYEVIMVCRIMPIRVAGNSGPLPREVSWVELAREINEKRRIYGMNHLVDENVIRKFEQTEAEVIREYWMPILPLHEYQPSQREEYSKELVEIHKEVFNRLSLNEIDELKKLFEMTTVTKKLRRIAYWSEDNFLRAVRMNRPKSLAITFLNYIFPTCWGCETWEELLQCPESLEIKQFLFKFKNDYGIPVSYVTCRPDKVIECGKELSIL